MVNTSSGFAAAIDRGKGRRKKRRDKTVADLKPKKIKPRRTKK